MKVDIYNTDKKYNIIYADPPWTPIQSGGGIRGTAGLKERYKGVMSLEEICNVPVRKISKENSILFLWVTFPRLLEGIKTIKEWGFEYYGLGFNWIKTNKKSNTLFWGMGYYTRQNSEICLIGVKDKKNRIKSKAKNILSVIQSPIQKHSKKPDEVRQKIVKVCGDLPRIELFARQEVDDWDCWGNEV